MQLEERKITTTTELWSTPVNVVPKRRRGRAEDDLCETNSPHAAIFVYYVTIRNVLICDVNIIGVAN